jgi:glycosyltransferase involved in cell wall biosynthesis
MSNLEIITLHTPGVTDFASARNLLLKKSKAEWVLFIDTDEKLSDELIKEISALNPKDCNGFVIKRKIVFLGREIGEDRVLRLARKNSGKWVRKVHETWQIKGRVGTLKGHIIHNTADNLHEYIEKMNRYSSIHAAENLKEGKRSNLFKMVYYPKLKFIQNILARRGFVFSVLQSFHSFLGWAKQWELQKD